MTEEKETFARLRTHLHRGGSWAYVWTLENKASRWFPTSRPLVIPCGKLNVYFGVHPTAKQKGQTQRATISDIAAINCLFADFDTKHLGGDSRVAKEQELAHVQSLTLKPSVIVDSGGGYHVYWLLADPFIIASEADRERAKKAQAAWVAYVDGDSGAKDLARVLRVPGTTNHKKEYGPNFPIVTIISAEFERVYALADLEAVARRAQEQMTNGAKNPSAPKHSPANGNGKYVESALAGELEKLAQATEGMRNTQLNASAFSLGQFVGACALERNEAEARLLQVSRAVGLGDHESSATIRSGIESGMKQPRAIPCNGNGHKALTDAPANASPTLTLEERIAALKRQVEQIPENSDKIQLPITLRSTISELAKLDKSIASAFLGQCIKPRFGLTYAEARSYESDLSKLREAWERSEKERRAKEAADKQAEAAKPKELTEAERAEAIEFLRAPDIVVRIISDISAMGYVGEDANKFMAYLVATSRKQDKPMSATIKSPSAYGKSELVKDSAVELMPPEDVLEFSRLTPQALSYMKPDALVHKLLVVTERNGAEESDYNIRVMQSEQKLKIAYPVKDPDTGEMQTSEREVAGPVAYLETTTRPTIHAENATRVYELYLDGSAGQTGRVHEAQRIGSTLAGLSGSRKREAIIRRHQNAQRLLQKVTVVIPFAEFIQFPTDNPRTRRDFPRFLETVKVIAFLRQFQKNRKTYADGDVTIEYIEADLDDYAIAYKYSAPIIAYGLDELPKHSRDLFNRIVEMVKSKTKAGEKPDEISFTRRDIRKNLGVTDKFIWDYIPHLEHKEYLEVISGGRGQKYVYKLPSTFLGESEEISVKGLTTPDELAEAIRLARSVK